MKDIKKPANRTKLGTFAKGHSGNPAGRPKDGESWAAIIKSVGDMYPADIVAFIGKDNDLGRMLSKLPQGVQMKYLVTARVFASLMFEPTSSLWRDLVDRAEGKVVQVTDITSGGEPLGKDDSDTKAEILRKLDGIATAAGAGAVHQPTDTETT